MNKMMKMYLTLICLTLAVATSAGSAWATIAGNTQITNQATLTYDGGSTKSLVVVVTVAVIKVAPTFTGSGLPTNYTGQNTPLANTFTITSNSNGPVTYVVTTPVDSSSNASGPEPIATYAGGNITVGATVSISGSGTTITVPWDGTATTTAVNGIRSGSKVVINSVEYTVAASGVSNPGTGTNPTATITLTSVLPGPLGAGVSISGKETFTVTVLSGKMTLATGGDITANFRAHLVDVALVSLVYDAAQKDTWIIGSASVTKYVRNTNYGDGLGGNLSGQSPTDITVNTVSHKFYTSGVTAAAGEVLEYVIVAINAAGGGTVNGAILADQLPNNYVTLKPGVYNSKDIEYSTITRAALPYQYTGAGAFTTSYSAANDADNGKYLTPNLTVYAGSSATSSAGGTIAADSGVQAAYQVIVNQ